MCPVVRIPGVWRSTLTTLPLLLLPLLNACVRVDTPVYEGQCGPWKDVEPPGDLPGASVLYFKGMAGPDESAARVHQTARAEALASLAGYCDVHVTSEELVRKFELNSPLGDELRMEARQGVRVESSVRLVGVRIDLTCREFMSGRQGARYREWTLISAPIDVNSRNCNALAAAKAETVP